MQVGTIIAPDGTEIRITPGNRKQFTLAELQRAVGGDIERVLMRKGNGRGTMYVDEEGKIKGKSPNVKATEKALAGELGDIIVGAAVIVTVEAGE